ncbi:MAG: amidase, partial [Pseudomonadales bacterium]
MDELLDRPLSEIATAIRDGKVASSRIVRAFLDRIESVNPDLNAVVYSTAELAMKYAAKCDAELANGSLRGPLHGVPMTIKDSLDTSDAITTWGTTGRKDFRPGRDATCVRRLKDAGAILMGKTNTPEFTLWFQTDNLIYGRTNNPFDLDRTPGGSSGGAAAIIAAGASPFDIGTDTGGSIRLPSHFSGIAGIKPTTGRVPCTGNALPSSGLLAPLSQPGPLARYVEDLALVLELIKGPDLIDPNAVEAVWHPPADVDVTSLRIGFHSDNGIRAPMAEISSVITRVCDLIRDEGLPVTEARPPGIEMTDLIMSRVFTADSGDMLDALVEDCRTREPTERVKRSLARPPLDISPREFAQILTLWDNYRGSMLGYFEDFDILLCPVNANTALLHGTEEDLKDYSYTTAFNLTGWPGTVIRAGTDSKGLPIGLQIVARPFREDHCLALADWLEQRLGPFPAPQVSAVNQPAV